MLSQFNSGARLQQGTLIFICTQMHEEVLRGSLEELVMLCSQRTLQVRQASHLTGLFSIWMLIGYVALIAGFDLHLPGC